MSCDRCEELEGVLVKIAYRLRQRRSFFNQSIEDLIDTVVKTTRTDQYLRRWGESEALYKERVARLKEEDAIRERKEARQRDSVNDTSAEQR